MRWLAVALGTLALVVALLGFRAQTARTLALLDAGAEEHASPATHESAASRVVSVQTRLDAITRAQVWKAPTAGSARGVLPANGVIDELSCRFVLKRLNGTTPKFNCVLGTGEEVRIKYGKGPEIPAEAAATRLLRALGFGADEITLVRHLRCYGCPLEPFAASKAVQTLGATGAYARVLDYDDAHDYEWVALERKYRATTIETATAEGWAFPELGRIDESKGGAPRAHVDALRLVAVFLADWDNKPDNQRLVCDSREWPDGAACPAPFMMLQDLGATFGPRKVTLRRWRTSTIWADRTRCRITMRHLPYSGATFQDVEIGDPGRQMAARLLGRLTDDDIANLFRGARFDQKRGIFSDARPVHEWVDAFRMRVRLIGEGAPCPAVRTQSSASD
jgi:hypothetical protein